MSGRVETEPPYRDGAQQHEAALLGMFVFLGSEFMLFGGIFLSIAVVRLLHRAEAVEASKQLHVWIGAANTVVLLTSSFAVAVAVEAARKGLARIAILGLGAATLLGLLFLGIKGVEYAEEYAAGMLPGFGIPTALATPTAHLFMNLYVIGTALHAIHLAVGVLLLAGLATALARGQLRVPRRAILLENAGLYWHLVDVIWIFLYPLLYLAR